MRESASEISCSRWCDHGNRLRAAREGVAGSCSSAERSCDRERSANLRQGEGVVVRYTHIYYTSTWIIHMYNYAHAL